LGLTWERHAPSSFDVTDSLGPAKQTLGPGAFVLHYFARRRLFVTQEDLASRASGLRALPACSQIHNIEQRLQI